MIDQKHKEIFDRVWVEGDYRLGSTALRMLKFILDVVPYTASVNDYGCGTGRLEAAMAQTRPVQKVTMIDISDKALEDEARELINMPTNSHCFILADLSDLSAVPIADWGLCINVLMTVQPEKLDAILSEIRRTCNHLIFEAYDFDDQIRIGMQLTTVKKNAAEWKETLERYWRSVKFYPSPESARRYIFVCEG